MTEIQLNLPLEFRTRQLLRCSMPRPDDRLHHLSHDRGGWVVRVTGTIMNRKGIATKRLRLRLGHGSEEDAIRLRDVAIRSWQRVGFRISQRTLVRGCRIDARGGQ